MPKSTYAILATFTSFEHGSMSALRAWSAQSPSPLWIPLTARHAHIPTRRGATSMSHSTWSKPANDPVVRDDKGRKYMGRNLGILTIRLFVSVNLLFAA